MMANSAQRLAELDQATAVVQKTIDRLKAMTPGEIAGLSLGAKQQRALALSDAFLAKEGLENARLKVLNDEFESRRPNLVWATDKLAEDLARLTDIVAFIGAAASAIGIVTDIVSIAG